MTTNKIYQVGVAGYGWAAGAHIEALNKTGRSQVTAVYSSRRLDPQELSLRHGSDITVYQDWNEFLKHPGLDVVDLCSYPNQHRDQAVSAAQAGKHLIVEKPMALSIEDCRAIAAAAEAAKVQGCVCFEGRFSDQFLATRKVIEEGLIGDIHYGEIDYYHGVGPWYGQFRWNIKKENGGSSLLSAGCHAIDALLLCMGGEVESVNALATFSKNAIFAQYEYPTTQVNIIKFKDGRIGKTASVLDCWQPYYFHTHLVGSEGSLLDNKFHTTKFGPIKKSGWSSLNMSLMDSGDVHDHPYQKQFEAFFEALDLNKPMPLTSLQESLRSFEVIFACDRSVELGRPVTLGE